MFGRDPVHMKFFKISDPASVSLLQPRVLGLGLLQDGDVGVGIFPQGEEVLVGGACFRFIAT